MQSYNKVLNTIQFNTPLGTMVVIANDTALYILEFTDRKGLQREIELLVQKTNTILAEGSNPIIMLAQKELALYFEGKLQQFTVPVRTIGSPFAQHVWGQLTKIPFGRTYSYADLAKATGNPQAYRAVAKANSVNHCAIIIPCHRVINSNGELGGYAGGLMRKRWLLNHEKNFRKLQ